MCHQEAHISLTRVSWGLDETHKCRLALYTDRALPSDNAGRSQARRASVAGTLILQRRRHQTACRGGVHPTVRGVPAAASTPRPIYDAPATNAATT